MLAYILGFTKKSFFHIAKNFAFILINAFTQLIYGYTGLIKKAYILKKYTELFPHFFFFFNQR